MNGRFAPQAASHSITAHSANEPSPSDQAPPMQRAVINQLSNGIALPNRSCIVQCRRKSRKIVALVPRERLEPPTDAIFVLLSQAALTLGQSQLMERKMLCPRITQQSLRKPLDAGCFEGDSTRAGPKPLVQLYDRDHLRSHLQKFSTINAVISIAYGEWCNGSTTDSDSVCLGSNPSSPASPHAAKCRAILFQATPTAPDNDRHPRDDAVSQWPLPLVFR